jgi:hypothetical protein
MIENQFNQTLFFGINFGFTKIDFFSGKRTFAQIPEEKPCWSNGKAKRTPLFWKRPSDVLSWLESSRVVLDKVVAKEKNTLSCRLF